MKKKQGKPVVVTTQYRGVFFGYVVRREGDSVVLDGCRNCLRWSSGVRGFIGLATTGPTKECRVGPAADDVELLGVTAIMAATDVAVAAWEKAPWA